MEPHIVPFGCSKKKPLDAQDKSGIITCVKGYECAKIHESLIIFIRGNTKVKPILGILLGEAAGIGPEIIAKLCSDHKLEKYCRPIIIGDARVLEHGKRIAEVDFPVSEIQSVSDAKWDGSVQLLNLNNFDPAEVKMGQIDIKSGKITGDMLVTAVNLCKTHEIEGFTYAPLNKAAFQMGGYDFKDETRLFAHYLGWDKPCGEMNVLKDLWTFRVTSHIPINSISKSLTKQKILDAITMAHETLKRAGYESPIIAVSGLNPHCGESGLCGREEIDVIIPAVKDAADNGISCVGPFSADTVFISAFKGEYNAVVTMYHDQGQIAIKLMDLQSGVTVAGGLPYAITTPAHGTAFDIAGKGTASPDAMEQAVMVAAKMAGWRN